MSVFKKVRNTINLLKSVDMDQLAKINQQIDLSEAMKSLGQLDERQLKGLMKMLKTKRKKGQSDLPPIDGDFYNLDLKLTEEQRKLQMDVRNFMEDEVRPLVNDHWNRAKFPHEIIEKFKKLNGETSAEEFQKRISELDEIFNQHKKQQDLGHVLRYIGEIEVEKATLEAKLISEPKNTALGQIKGADNIFEIYTESYGDQPLVIQGAGAGAAVTARGVASDVLKLSQRLN